MQIINFAFYSCTKTFADAEANNIEPHPLDLQYTHVGSSFIIVHILLRVCNF